MNIQEKFNEWWSKAIKGKPGFQIVSCESDKWQYQFEGQQSPVTAAAACIWDDSQVYFNRSWNGKEPIDPGKKLFTVVKDDEKLMFVIEDVGLFPFGIKSDKGDHYRAALFVQCGWLSTLITATSDPPAVIVRGYAQNEFDPLSCILPELFKHMLTEHTGKEDSDHARATGPSTDDNLG